jgi:2-(1,2-epoxy-1,2-dihydrophenyl)acetyl-CoA isomerase
VLEERARDISGGLRCIVCRNESIDESNAELARDLRLLVRERLVAGDSDEEVVAYVVDRYGEFVLLRVLVMTGEGKAFCSGQDLSTMATRPLSISSGCCATNTNPCCMRSWQLPIAGDQRGERSGGGGRGEPCADGGRGDRHRKRLVSCRLSRGSALSRMRAAPIPCPGRWASAKAMGAALFAEPISARQADQWGMIWEAVPDEAFDGHWRARAAHLANGPTVAYRHVKEALRASWDNSLSQQLDLEARLQGACGETRDFKEGVLAFLEKRKATFEGR